MCLDDGLDLVWALARQLGIARCRRQSLVCPFFFFSPPSPPPGRRLSEFLAQQRAPPFAEYTTLVAAMRGLLPLVAGLAALCTALAAPLEAAGGVFSLAVAEKQAGKRDFVRDWAAAHRKWGAGVPGGAFKTLILAQGGK